MGTVSLFWLQFWKCWLNSYLWKKKATVGTVSLSWLQLWKCWLNSYLWKQRQRWAQFRYPGCNFENAGLILTFGNKGDGGHSFVILAATLKMLAQFFDLRGKLVESFGRTGKKTIDLLISHFQGRRQKTTHLEREEWQGSVTSQWGLTRPSSRYFRGGLVGNVVPTVIEWVTD